MRAGKEESNKSEKGVTKDTFHMEELIKVKESDCEVLKSRHGKNLR